MSNTIDVCISLDTTGSMSQLRQSLRRTLQHTLQDLFSNVTGCHLGLMVHGDDANRGEVYDIKVHDLTSNLRDLGRFLNECGDTKGGGPHANYERVLHEARKLSWRSGKNKVLVIIGDEVPHAPNFVHNNGKRYDWRNELGLLLEMGVAVYGVHCLPYQRPGSEAFYREIAQKTGGFYLTLDQFEQVTDLVKACVFKQESDGALHRFQEEVQRDGRMNRSQMGNFNTLRGTSAKRSNPTGVWAKDLPGDAVPPGRFQILSVPTDRTILDFVQDHGLRFQTGRGFYEFTKSVEIQDHKEVVLQDRTTGDMFTGQAARQRLGLPTRGTVKIGPRETPAVKDYRAFIQSTSYNRKLVGGTKFLYEADLQ